MHPSALKVSVGEAHSWWASTTRKADAPSSFPALTQIEVYGFDA